MQIQHISGSLTDHYDPRNKTLSLSDAVYNATTVAAIGVAAHECGHAMQHAKAMCRFLFEAHSFQLSILVLICHGR